MKLQHALLFLIVFVCNSVTGQNQEKVDSISKLFNSSTDNIEKVKLAQKLFHLLKHDNPKASYKYAKIGLNLSEESQYKTGEGLNYLNFAYYYRFSSNVDSSRIYFKKSISTLKNQNQEKLWIALNEYAIFETLQGDFETALKLADSGYRIAVELKSGKRMADNIQRKSTIHMDNGNFKSAMEETLKSLKIIDTIKPEDKIGRGIAIGDIGRIEMLRGNYKQALKPLKDALEIFIELKYDYWICSFYTEIGNVYWYLKDYNASLNNYEKSLELSRKIKRDDLISANLCNIADIYSRKGEHSKAIKMLEESIGMITEQGSINNLIVGHNQIGDISTRMKNYNRAISNYTKAIALADSIKALNLIRDSYYGRSVANEKSGNFMAALKDQRDYQIINDSIFNITKSKQIEELKTIYETEKKETQIALQNEEIKTLNVQAKNDKLTKTLYGTGMFSFIAIAGLLFFGFKQRIKKNKIEQEKQEAIYKQEIAFKKKELASQTLHLVQKSTFIQELKENLEKIKKSPELFKVEFRRLVMLLKKESAEDKDWEIFKSYFSEVHNNFDNKLKTVYADITEKEIRLASFLRMNLSTKEIASMLNVLPESVLKSKYRLKKKLKLDKETDLNVFLNSL